MVLRTIIVVFFLTQLHFSGKALNNDSITNSIFSAIYMQQFERAEALLQAEKDELDAFVFNVLNIDLLWWKFSSTRAKEDAENLNDRLEKYIKSGIEKNDTVAQLVGKSYQLRYARKKFNLFDVISMRSEVNDLLSELDRNKLSIAGNELKLFDLYIDLFHYFNLVHPFSVWSKSAERDFYISKMEVYASDKNLIVKTMADYFLGRIYQKVEREPEKAREHFLILTREFPENQIFLEHLQDCEKKR